jgi:dTDP-4-amino-4,6-dideoxygalactose transaminase
MSRRQLPAYSPLTLGRVGAAVIDSLLSAGRARAELSSYLATTFGAARVCLTASGTQALQLAIEVAATTRKERGVVALPAYSCYDLVTAAVGAGEPVTFYDLDPTTLTPDLDSLRAALRAGATTLVAANLYGFPLDWDSIRAECSHTGAFLIEDAAQGLGGHWRGTPSGSFGDLTVLSFSRGKGWTGGGGGALLARAALDGNAGEVFERGTQRRPLRLGGMKAGVQLCAQWCLGRPMLYGIATSVPGTHLGETRYREPQLGSGMPAFCAWAVRGHADLAREHIATRRQCAAEWDALWQDEDMTGWVPARPVSGGEAGYLRYPLIAETPAEATRLVEGARGAGVEQSYPRTLPSLGAAQSTITRHPRSTPGASRLAQCLVTLPSHGMVDGRDVELVRRLLLV